MKDFVTDKINLIAFLSLLLATTIWGSSFIALKLAINDLGPFSVIFFRMFIASLCFIYFVPKFFKYSFTKKDIKLIILLATCEPFLYFIFEAKALQHTSAAQAGMIIALMPIITTIGATYFLKEKISKQFIIGAIIALIGAVLLSVIASESLSAPNPIRGNFYEFLAVVCSVGYTLCAKYLIKKFDALFITSIQAFIGTVLFLPLFIYEYNSVELNFSSEAIYSLLYLGVIVTLGGYGLYNFALSKIDASKASVFMYLSPISTLILANVILNEEITFMQVILSFVILFGVVVSEIKLKSKN